MATATAEVVIVDDAVEYRQLLTIHLEAAGMRVAAQAADQTAGLARVVEHAPDLVVTDMQMVLMGSGSQISYAKPISTCRSSWSQAAATRTCRRVRPRRATMLVDKSHGPAAVAAAARELC